jgi:hypothetical protein
MRYSRQVLVIAFVLIVLGIGLIVGASIQVPYKTFLGIPYDVNPTFEFLFMWGILFLGFGLGIFGANDYVLRLEKKLSQIPSSPQTSCRYCGAENAPDSVFCSKRGKKLT